MASSKEHAAAERIAKQAEEARRRRPLTVGEAEAIAERVESAAKTARAAQRAAEAVSPERRTTHGVRQLARLSVSEWPYKPAKDAYDVALGHITSLAELGDPRMRMACEQAARMVVLVQLLYQHLAEQLAAGNKAPPILKQIATYENALSRMLQGLGMTLRADYRRVVQPETITSYLERAQEVEEVDGDEEQDKPAN